MGERPQPGQRPGKLWETRDKDNTSPEGAEDLSPGQRPGKLAIKTTQALKGRKTSARGNALRLAIQHNTSPERAKYLSPGQRPGELVEQHSTSPEGAKSLNERHGASQLNPHTSPPANTSPAATCGFSQSIRNRSSTLPRTVAWPGLWQIPCPGRPCRSW